MLVKPLASSSIKYINVPKMIHKIKTPKIKTEIFARLARKAISSKLDSLIYLVSFNILKTLNSLKAFNAIKLCVPARKKERYFGKVDSKSMMP